MKRPSLSLLVLLSIVLLVACSPGHLGGNIIAFVRDGQLWTIDPNGNNAFAIVEQGPPVVGYNWSPNHQLVAFRTLDPDYAKSAEAQGLSGHSPAQIVPDVPSTVNTVGIDGGTPIALAFSSPDVRYNNPLWNASGNRLIYRQTSLPPPTSPDQVTWWIAQNDQPGGIAAKGFPSTYSIPSFSYTTHLLVGNSDRGLFTTTLAASDLRVLEAGGLSGHPLPAALERVLWQPNHSDARLLYAVASSPTQNASAQEVQLMLRTANGQITPLATCTCQQFAWSPDGNYIIYSSGSDYTLVQIEGGTSFTIKGDEGSVPYWSPNSRLLLLDGPHSLRLVRIAEKQETTLLSDTSEPEPQFTTVPTSNALLQPVPNTLWADDSSQFVFLTQNRLSWQGQQLSTGQGIYRATLNEQGKPEGMPQSLVKGNATQVGWGYLDANTSFLY